MLKTNKEADQGTLLNIETAAAKRESSKSPEKLKEGLKISKPRTNEQTDASPTLSTKKQPTEAKSPTNRRTTVKRFKDEEKHDQSSVGSPSLRPDSPASIMKSQRSRESRRKSPKKKKEESDKDQRADRIHLNLGDMNKNAGESPRIPNRNDDVIMGQQKRILE